MGISQLGALRNRRLLPLSYSSSELSRTPHGLRVNINAPCDLTRSNLQRRVNRDFYGAQIGVIGMNGSRRSLLLGILSGVDKESKVETVDADIPSGPASARMRYSRGLER